MRDAIKKAYGIHQKIAEDVVAPGDETHCKQCGDVQALDAALFAFYLKNGWKCACGGSLRLVTQKEKDAEGGSDETD